MTVGGVVGGLLFIAGGSPMDNGSELDSVWSGASPLGRIILIGCGVIWMIVVWGAWEVCHWTQRRRSLPEAKRVLLWVGFVLPVVSLLALLGAGASPLKGPALLGVFVGPTGLAIGVLLWIDAYRWHRFIAPYQCPQCRYDMRGLATGRCPECGCECAPMDPDGPFAPSGRRAR